MKRRVIFRADGNYLKGYGHFVRCLGLADIIKDDFECVFATQTPTAYQIQEINKVCEKYITLDCGQVNSSQFLRFINVNDIVVLDDYDYTKEYQLIIRSLGCKVVLIDDFNHKEYVCDALINNIPGFKEESFKKEPYTKLYLGTDFALLRKEFLNPEIRKIEKLKNIAFISFGGADFYNLSMKYVDFVKRINSDVEINVLVGDAYKHYEELSSFDNINVFKNINATDVISLIAKSTICIVPASSLLNEVAAIGSSIILGYFTENQLQPYRYFVDNNLAIGVDDFRETEFQVFEKKFDEALESLNILIKNQFESYKFQQNENLKKIFYAI